MKWELQESFVISKRLATWARRDRDFNKPKQEPCDNSYKFANKRSDGVILP